MEGSRKGEAPGMSSKGGIHDHCCKADPAAKDGREGSHNPLGPLAWDQAGYDRQGVRGCHQVAQQVQADDIVALHGSKR